MFDQLNIFSFSLFPEFYSDSDQESSPSSEDFLEEDHRSSNKRHDKMDGVEEVDAPMLRPRTQQIIAGETTSLTRSRTPSPALSDRRSRRLSNELSDDGTQRFSMFYFVSKFSLLCLCRHMSVCTVLV